MNENQKRLVDLATGTMQCLDQYRGVPITTSNAYHRLCNQITAGVLLEAARIVGAPDDIPELQSLPNHMFRYEFIGVLLKQAPDSMNDALRHNTIVE